MQRPEYKEIEEQMTRYEDLADSTNDSYLREIFNGMKEGRAEQLRHFHEE